MNLKSLSHWRNPCPLFSYSPPCPISSESAGAPHPPPNRPAWPGPGPAAIQFQSESASATGNSHWQARWPPGPIAAVTTGWGGGQSAAYAPEGFFNFMQPPTPPSLPPPSSLSAWAPPWGALGTSLAPPPPSEVGPQALLTRAATSGIGGGGASGSSLAASESLRAGAGVARRAATPTPDCIAGNRSRLWPGVMVPAGLRDVADAELSTFYSPQHDGQESPAAAAAALRLSPLRTNPSILLSPQAAVAGWPWSPETRWGNVYAADAAAPEPATGWLPPMVAAVSAAAAGMPSGMDLRDAAAAAVANRFHRPPQTLDMGRSEVHTANPLWPSTPYAGIGAGAEGSDGCGSGVMQSSDSRGWPGPEGT
jgi:hypothetical protein